MQAKVIIFIAAVMLTGCVHLGLNNKLTTLEKVMPGDTKESVFKACGPPDFRNDITAQRFIAFYQTKALNPPDTPLSPAFCTPIAFENGTVVEVGNDLTEPWTREENERIVQAEIAERKRKEKDATEYARRQTKTERQKKIAALEKKVKPIPVSKAALNLDLYRQLLDLDPANHRYQKKVAFYEERLVQQKKARRERSTRMAKEKHKQTWEDARDQRNIKLRQYTGNGTAEMAVHDIGPGSLYIWVKNVSKQVITTYPDNFTLLDIDNNKASLEISDSLDSVLEPGSISHGKIGYNQQIEPKELIFQNRESGRISKSFQ